MKISQLIKQLENVKSTNGDMEVASRGNDGKLYVISKVNADNILNNVKIREGLYVDYSWCRDRVLAI